MGLVAEPITVGLVVDTNEKMTVEKLIGLFAAGVRVLCRYFPLPGNSASQDLDADELVVAATAGLVVFAVQHPRSPSNNVLSATTGGEDADCALAHAKLIGYVPTVEGPVAISLDMEGVKNPGPDSFAHAQAWVTKVLAAGYQALIYLGYDCGLTSSQCNALVALGRPGQVLFWCDAGPYESRPSPAIGFVLKQHEQSTMAGAGVDEDDLLMPGALFGMTEGEPVEETVDPHEDPVMPHE
jgi:hypothetical protein